VRHSWITGLYWTLTAITLGFGDITFHSDLGRGFTILVLLSGGSSSCSSSCRSPSSATSPRRGSRRAFTTARAAPARLSGHVILCRYDEVARLVIERLGSLEIPYLVLEPDPIAAASLHSDGVAVVVGELDAVETYAAAGAARARALVANLGDAINTNITLTVREVARILPCWRSSTRTTPSTTCSWRGPRTPCRSSDGSASSSPT
jgi:hypothetical protein